MKSKFLMDADSIIQGVERRASMAALLRRVAISAAAESVKLDALRKKHGQAEFLTGHIGLGQFVFKRPSSYYRPRAEIEKILPFLPSLKLANVAEEEGGELEDSPW